MEASPALRVVIVAWNAGDDLSACVTSLLDARRDRFRFESIVVVDNASTDDAVARMQRAITGRTDASIVRAVRNEANVGYARAANQGARELAGADVVLFFNPDARVQPETIDVVIGHLAAHADVGICGVLLEDAAGAAQRECARFPTPSMFLAKSFALDLAVPHLRMMDDGDPHVSRDVDHVMGSCYFVRASLFAQLGGFDERFFVYLEDLDFSLRAHEAGYRSHYLAEARAFHRGGKHATTARPTRLAYSLESRLVYAQKHFPPAAAAAVTLATFVVEPWPRLARAALRRAPGEAATTLRAYGLLAQRMLRRRRRQPSAQP